MSEIYLIRHGQASFHHEDYDQLSKLGFNQSEVLGEVLTKKCTKPDCIVTGSMRRHQETATTAIGNYDQSQLPTLLVDTNWNEFDHENVLAVFNPAWADMSVFRTHIMEHPTPQDFFLKSFGQSIERWISGEHEAEYQEAWSVFKTRVLFGLEQLLKRLAPDQNALVFTSGGPISVITMNLLGIPDEKLLTINASLVNAGVTKLVRRRKRLHLSTLNEYQHFEGEERGHLLTYK